MELPERNYFPKDSKFYIKEFDVPLVQDPSGQWFNWYGGVPKEYDVTSLKPGNNWEAESFEEWAKVLKDSI